MCSILKNHRIFAACENVVDPAPYVDACKYDLCGDANSVHRDVYLCRSVAHYAQECSNRGVTVDWMNDASLNDLRLSCANSNYGVCRGGSKYNECARQVNTTCKDLSFRASEKYINHYNQADRCVAGCECPENQYFENVNGRMQCVEKDSCSCYDLVTHKDRPTGYKIKKGCSTW